MAFNPFASFRKYQKFWMASLVLLAMVTFVLCQGLGQGGLEDRLLKYFGARQGPTMATLNGRDLHSTELNDLRNQRKVANEFMRKFCDNLIKKANEAIAAVRDKPQEDKQRTETVLRATQLQREFAERLKKPFYFGSGVKLDELVDFKMWL